MYSGTMCFAESSRASLTGAPIFHLQRHHSCPSRKRIILFIVDRRTGLRTFAENSSIGTL